MGYDFEALETGELNLTLHRWDGKGKETPSFKIEKGKKYSWDFDGKIRIR